MTGYSKLRFLNKKSRSIDFSDLLITNTFPDDQTKTTHDQDTSPTGLDHSRKSTAHEEINTIHEHDSDEDQAADDSTYTRKSTDKSVGVIHLSKNSSVSQETSSHWFNLRKQRSAHTNTTTTTTTARTSSAPKSGLQSAVKGAFSMRRSWSSSVSHHEKYRRIHDQCVAILLESYPFDDDDGTGEVTVESKEDNIPNTMNTMGSMESKKRENRGKILKACKSLLGFYQ